MTQVRCLFCLHPAATEREFQRRFGPEVALAGPCGHSENGAALVNSRYCCERWESLPAHKGTADPS
jgi:hypothetical protein